MEGTLLLVDDEENILSALTRLLRRDGYRILRANGGKAGLEILKCNEVSVIISDQRMPEMTGVEFLSQVKELYPDTVRIVLSGYTELNSVTNAINKGSIYKFLTKPWDDNLLRNHVREAFEYFEWRHQNERINCDLKIKNQSLEHNIKEKKREISFNLKAVQIAQDLLEHLPAGVIGITDDGEVAVANQFAEKIFSCENNTLVGCNITEFLPSQVFDLNQLLSGQHSVLTKVIELEGEGVFDVRCSRLTTGTRQGMVMLLVPREDDR